MEKPRFPLRAIFWSGTPEENFLGHIFSEIYKEQIYEPYLIGKKDLTIVEVGAHVGIASLYFSQYAKQVYAVEPSAEHFFALSTMLDFNRVRNVKPIKKAIYIEKKVLPFYHNRNKTMYSLHQAVEDNSQPTEGVEAISLADLFEEEKIEHADLLKLDVEGSEIEILSGKAFREIAPKIELIIGESHGWSGRNPNQLREALRKAGFSFEIIPAQANIFVAKKK